MATTGEVPPNTNKGESFVHDPKISGDTQTKAQIKLRFDTVDGKTATAIRSMQVSKKGKKLAYKTIDNALQMYNASTGNTDRVSFRNADMDIEVAKMMGVSKAVLENVIFVHQDDSNWPLAEPAVLKKKFDDIFEATKFTSALADLKKAKKEQADQLKESKLRLETIGRDKRNAERLRMQIGEAESKIKALSHQIEEHEKAIEHADGEIEAHEGELEELRQASNDVSVLEAQREDKQRAVRQAEQVIERDQSLAESEGVADEMLETTLANIGDRTKGLENEQDQNKRTLRTCTIDADSFKGRQAKQSRALGKVQAEAEAARSRSAELEASVIAACRALGLPSPGSAPLPERALSGAITQLKAEVQTRRERLRAHRSATQSEVAKLSAKVDAAAVALAGANETSRMKRAAAEHEAAKEVRLREQLREGESALRQVAQVERDAESVLQQVEAKRKALDQAEHDRLIRSLENEAKDASRELADLQAEQQSLVMAQQTNAQVRLMEQQKEQKESAASTALRRACDAARRVEVEVDEGDTADGLLRRLRAESLRLKDERRQAEEKSSAASREADIASSRADEKRRTLASHEEALSEAREDVQRKAAAVGVSDPTPEALVKAREDLAECARNVEQKIATQTVFTSLKTMMHSEEACPCCSRAFNNDAERDAAAAHLEGNVASLPGQIEQLKAGQTKAKQTVEMLERVDPLLRRVRDLEDLIPEARQARDDAERAVEGKQEEADDAGIKAQKAADAEEAMRDALPKAEEAVRGAEEARSASAELASLRRKLGASGTHAGRDVSELAEAIHEAEKRRSSAQQERDFKIKQFGMKKDELANLERQHAAVREQLNEQRHKASQRMTAAKGADEAAAAAASLREAAKAAEESTTRLAREKAAAEDARDSANCDGQVEEDRLTEQLNEAERTQQRVDQLVRAVQADRQAGREEAVEREKAKLEEFMREEEEAVRRRRNAQDKVDQVVQQLAGMDKLRRQTQDVLNLRRLRAQVMSLEERAAAARAKGSLDRKRKLSQTLKLAREQAQKSREKRDQALGARRAIESTREEANGQLADRQYRDVDDKYRDMLVTFSTAEMVVSDLDKYMKALERALTEFHTQKMAEINRTIKELWQNVYRNQDIDKLEIRSDVDEGARGAASRSHNYRVVMTSASGAEMDMRGRCSAGQRVLASLIIRLALAESFCVTCGVLALDEPTTNLDEPNAHALAEALTRLMESRRGQENFQLVVITHDEKFARSIGLREHAEKYWRVAKDRNQKSTIHKQDIFG